MVDDFRMGKTPAGIGKGDGQLFPKADDGGIRADLHDRFASFPDVEEKPPASTRKQQDETPDDIPEFPLHRLLASKDELGAV
jgi:hypothetical protein